MRKIISQRNILNREIFRNQFFTSVWYKIFHIIILRVEKDCLIKRLAHALKLLIY